MEDIVIVDSKDYAQVIFDEINECYMEHKPLECLFTLNEYLKADASDFIGIYRVGFSSSKEHVTTQAVTSDAIKEDNKGKITFPGDKLPKDDGEFYQFVYVSHSKQIRGASIPFQFKRTHVSDYVVEQVPLVDSVCDELDLSKSTLNIGSSALLSDNAAILIKSKTEQQKKEPSNDMVVSELKSRNDTCERLLKETEGLVSSLREELTACKTRCLRLTGDNEKLAYALKAKTDACASLNDTLTALTNEHNKLQNRFNALTHEHKTVHESLQQRIAHLAQLELELAELRRGKETVSKMSSDFERINEQIVSLEKQVSDRCEELARIRGDLKRNELLVSEQAGELERLAADRQRLTKEKLEADAQLEQLAHELNMTRDKLAAAEQCREMSRTQLTQSDDELREARAKCDAYLATVQEQLSKEKRAEQDKAELVQRLAQTKSDYELKLEQANGAYYALKLAHVHLEAKLKNASPVKKLNEENEELKERIRQGAKEYSKLVEKFRLYKMSMSSYYPQQQQQMRSNTSSIYQDLNQFQHHQPMSASAVNYNNLTDVIRHELKRAEQQQQMLRHSTPAVAAAARATSTEIENTILDALLTNTSSSNDWVAPPKVVDESHASTAIIYNENGSDESLVTTTKKLPSTSSADDVFVDATSNPAPATTATSLADKLAQHQQQQSLQCDICGYAFSTTSDSDIEAHYATHYGPQCPVCLFNFHKGYSLVDFEKHVNSHFPN